MKVNFSGVPFSFRFVIRSVLKSAKIFKELTFAFVSENAIKTLNKKFRNKDAVTDVLSFPANDDDYLGDVIICIKRAKMQAKAYNHPLKDEVAFLACHGLLHLLGYDHKTPNEETEMFSLQNKILDNTKYKGAKR